MTFLNRRRFMKALTAIAASPLLLRTGFASAPLSEDDPTAKALGYKADAATVDDPSFKAGSTCANCMQYQPDAEGAGACAVFPGKSVSAAGWCKAWVRKT